MVIPALLARINLKLLGAVLVVAAAGIAGWKAATWRAEAGQAAAERERSAAAELEYQLLVNELEHEREVNAGVSRELADAQAAMENDRRAFEEKLNEARRRGAVLRCHQPARVVARVEGVLPGDRLGAGDGAGAVCDGACIGLWHDALAQGLPAAYGSWRAHAGAAAPRAVTDAELLANAGENFRLANACRAQVLGWQKWARERGLVR